MPPHPRRHPFPHLFADGLVFGFSDSRNRHGRGAFPTPPILFAGWMITGPWSAATTCMSARKSFLDYDYRLFTLKATVAPTGTRADPGIAHRMVGSLNVTGNTRSIYRGRHVHSVKQKHGLYPMRFDGEW